MTESEEGGEKVSRGKFKHLTRNIILHEETDEKNRFFLNKAWVSVIICGKGISIRYLGILNSIVSFIKKEKRYENSSSC